MCNFIFDWMKVFCIQERDASAVSGDIGAEHGVLIPEAEKDVDRKREEIKTRKIKMQSMKRAGQ